MDGSGLDSDGRQFAKASEMWELEIGTGSAGGEGNGTCCGGGGGDKRRDWYRKGIAYWQGVEASVDGVLGGYGCVNEPDVKGSEGFLKPLLADRFGKQKRHLVALDCGSGIGRVTKNLLLRYFNEVDLVEPVSHFLEAAHEKLSSEGDMDIDTHKAVNFFCVPLQEFTPEAGRYDVIWIQWCIGQLPDDDFVSFFKRAKVGLKPDGFFVVKENIARQGFVLDKEDNSITRSDLYFKELFNQCGLYIYKTKDQKGLPEELFAVKMYALVTDKPRVGKSKVPQYKPGIIK
ncbi:Alpha-N-methyltransferase NTM1 protein [Dioscorea alata]|uniref:Alpha-N-methyltransferase NTM1 protein n=2 Tax=Dioscorea alata TaxID=55571 RepID=A0ACB7VHY3_DIOAL|nr:Alpha-N-methyltransferase NTM1 protein [Dioscorea alata]KAH7673704.1 Alpha-N-methyltransferase NTM1 protein [Dioscorea alata]